jgi:catechol 2,3-dioxygenase-like lactoylglutathione lyase family enzyme
MSPAIEFVLDHLAVVVPDLSRAQRHYERLGFRLTRRSSHKGPLVPNGPMEIYGSGNHCSMFREGYLEILGITDPARYTGRVVPLLKRYAGLHLVALGCRDAQQAAAIVGERLGAQLTVRDLGRDVPYGETDSRPALFRIVGLPDESFTEAELFLIEQATPEVLWQLALLDQPNGVVALAGVTLCVRAPAETAVKLARILGMSPDSRSFRLERGTIDIDDASVISARYGITPAILPLVAVARYAVSDLAATAGYLRKRRVGFREQPGRLWVMPSDAEGAIVEFVPA